MAELTHAQLHELLNYTNGGWFLSGKIPSRDALVSMGLLENREHEYRITGLGRRVQQAALEGGRAIIPPSAPAPDWSALLACGEAIIPHAGDGKPMIPETGLLLSCLIDWLAGSESVRSFARYHKVDLDRLDNALSQVARYFDRGKP